MEIMLDLDGVLVAFMKGAAKFHGISFDPYPKPGEWFLDKSITGMSINDFWNPLGHDFWNSLKWWPDGGAILKLCVDAVGWNNICLLTSPTRLPGCVSGKMAWIQRETPKLARQFIITPKKHFCDNGKRILIDDANHNIDNWTGPKILVPRPWNRGHDIKTPAIICFKKCLDELV